MFRSVLLAVYLLFAFSAEASPFPVVRIQGGDAARVAIRVNDEVVPPVFFAANNQWGRDDVLLEGIRIAAANGTPNFTFNLLLPSFTGADAVRATLDKFASANPAGHFLIRVWLGPTHAWLEAHPDDRMRRAVGAPTDYASLASEAWRAETDAQLRALLEIIAASPHAAQFLGLHLCYLNTGEWFPPNTDDFFDYSPANTSAFAKWYAHEYPAAPATGLPTPAERDAAGWGPFRDPARSLAAMAYDRYWAALNVDTIAHFATTVKDATDQHALVGVFYGYTFELNHNGPRALAHSGHIALARLLHVPQVDIIAAPYAYFERGIQGPAHFHLPVDSVALHGKLAIMEDDSFTDLAMEPADHALAPGWDQRTKDRPASLALVRRNSTLFAEHRCGWWMFDLLSDGRWNHADFWNALQPAMSSLAQPTAFAPRIAFLPNEEAVPLLTASTHPELLQSLGAWRHELARLGEPVGYYLQSDLPNLPTSVRTVILPNAYIVRPDERAALDALLTRGGTIVWTYAPGLFAAFPTSPTPLGAASVLERVGQCTGFPIVEAGPGRTALRLEANGQRYETDSTPWRARLAVAPGDTEVLARYADNNAIAIARRRQGKGIALYAAVPRLPNEFLQSPNP